MPIRFSTKQSLAAGSGSAGEGAAKRRFLQVGSCRQCDFFTNAEHGTQVWQLQLVKTGQNNINYKLLDTARAALPTFEAMGPKADL
eukprot:6473145-Amphidinium_carterae.1